MRSITRKSVWAPLGIVLLLLARASNCAAQGAQGLDLGGAIAVGGEAERYLRLLQMTGAVPLYPWTIQSFTSAQSQRLTPTAPHVWSGRFAPDSIAKGFSWRWLRPAARAAYNTSYAFQDFTGPAWTGRGLSVDIQAGVQLRWRFISLQLAPVAFEAQNAAFGLAPAAANPYGDPRFNGAIDLPQRFGNKPYGRVDAGSSTLTFDVPGVSFGVSTAPQRVGPGMRDGLVLGPNGGGFLHAFIGTRQPVDLWVARFHARYILGQLNQSDYADVLPDHKTRLAAAFMVTLMPRGLDGLEIGAIKWSEQWMPHKQITLYELLRPFNGGFNRDFTGGTTNVNILGENSMASAFFRWVVPTARAEVYGEMYREDFAGDLRRFLEKPDDLASYLLGIHFATTSTPDRMRVFRAEIVNGQLSHEERGQRGFVRDFPPYLHGEVAQGHTVRGMLLGSPDAYGGAGAHVGIEEFTPAGRTSIMLERTLRMEHLTVLPPGGTNDGRPDVMYAVRFEAVRFRGSRDYTLTVVPAIDLNRYLVPGRDEFNLYVSFGARGWR